MLAVIDVFEKSWDLIEFKWYLCSYQVRPKHTLSNPSRIAVENWKEFFACLINQVEQLTQLSSLVEAELTYHQQSADILRSLLETLQSQSVYLWFCSLTWVSIVNNFCSSYLSFYDLETGQGCAIKNTTVRLCNISLLLGVKMFCLSLYSSLCNKIKWISLPSPDTAAQPLIWKLVLSH